MVPVGAIDWGGLRNFNPVSDDWGFDRGKPIDRYYIEKFLAANAPLIRGDCIEVLSRDYTNRFGSDRVTQSDVLDIDPENGRATIVGDLTNPATLRVDAYDCFVLTQTLPVIYDARAALANAYSATKPGGALLITVPALCRYSPHPMDYWRFTRSSLTKLIGEATDASDYVVEDRGNLIASLAFLIGASCRELTPGELDFYDQRFPIIVTARVVKRKARG
jgi:hypothetical protein